MMSVRGTNVEYSELVNRCDFRHTDATCNM